MKVALVFIILLVVLLPLMGASMTGDGTLKGRLQTFVSYGLSLTSLLLCLLTIIISIYSLTSDIEQRQIYTVLTKPIRRFQLLLGKLLGVILLDVALLALFSAIIYTITIYTPRYFGVSQAELTRLKTKYNQASEAEQLGLEDEIFELEDELYQLNNEFLTARASLIPPEADVTHEVIDIYEELEKTGQLPPGASRKKIIAELTSRKKLEKQAAAVGEDLIWEFNNVKPLDPDQSLFIRFKYDVSVNPPDLHVYSSWLIGDVRQFESGIEIETPIYTFDRKDLIRTFHEIEVPADAVAQDGYLAVGFFNVPLNDTVVIFPLNVGLEVLYKADTFTANFLRAVCLILLRLIFLACLGILASTFLSFPVAVLLSLCVFFTATISGFLVESFDFLSENLSALYSYTLRPVITLLPQFDKFDPAKFLVPARLLSWSLLAKVTGLMICIKASLLLLLALLVFSFREIAKIII